MATKVSSTLQMTNSTAALFQAWVQFIEDTLVTTGGWVVSTDTGQMTIASATAPAATNAKVGYRIYKMNDSLQATAPVFMRIDYGSGANAATQPGFWITIGTGSSGAGAITGVLYNGGAAASPNISAGQTAAAACNSYGSASPARAHVLLFTRTAANDLMLFSIERTKDATGADTSAGLLLVYSSGSASVGTVDTVQYLILAGGSQPPVEIGVSCALSNQTSSAFGADVGVGLPLHFKSVAQQPGTGVIIVNSGDFLAEGTPSMSLYGSVRTYQLSNSATNQVYVPSGNGAKTLRANTRVGIRYD